MFTKDRRTHQVLSKYGATSDGASCSAPRLRAEAHPNTIAFVIQSSASSSKAASASLPALLALPPAAVASLSMLCSTDLFRGKALANKQSHEPSQIAGNLITQYIMSVDIVGNIIITLSAHPLWNDPPVLICQGSLLLNW